MRNFHDQHVAEFAKLAYEIQRMLYEDNLDFNLVKFQLTQLTQNNTQGIIAQIPTYYKVYAPGSLEPTLLRLRACGWLDQDIPKEVLENACETCFQVESGTLFDVVKVDLWILGEEFRNLNEIFVAAWRKGLTERHNSWLPFVIADQFKYDNTKSAYFLLRKFGRFNNWELRFSPGSTTRVLMNFRHRPFWGEQSYCFVREKMIPAQV